MTPWVPSLFAELEGAARALLGLGPEVRLRARPAEGWTRVAVDLPNDEVFGLRLRGAELRVEGPDTPSKATIERLHRAWVRKAPERVAALEAARGEVEHLEGLDDAFYRRLFTGPQGTIANLRLGFGCNQDCGLCWQSRRWPDPPDALLETWLEELGQAGVRQLTISGGEPTVRRGLPGLLARARALGMRTMVQTNAVRLARGVGPVAGADRLFVSLHAADPELSDRITRAPGTHERTLRGLRAALDAGLRVGISTVVDRLNLDDLAPLARLIARRFPEVESVTWSKPQPYFDRGLWEARLAPWDTVRTPLLQAIEIVREAGIVPDATSGSCGVPACLLRSLPEHIHLPPAESLGMADAGFGSRPPICESCALSDRCQGPGSPYVERYGERGLVAFPEAPELRPFPITL